MKLLAMLPVFLIASNAFASDVCLVSYSDDATRAADGSPLAQVYIGCNSGNSDSRTITLKVDTASTNDIATVIAGLLTKGYKLVSQSNDIWTLVKG